MRPKKMTGIVLNHYPHGDYDRVLSIFSYEYGRALVIAKGVRRIKSIRGFHLDVLSALRMELEQSTTKGILYLREVSTINAFTNMKASPPHFGAACLIASFLHRILPEGAIQKKLYELTETTLNALNAGRPISETLLTYFLKSMRLLGYMPPTLPTDELRPTLFKTLSVVDPQFTLQARRMLGIFSSFESTPSS